MIYFIDLLEHEMQSNGIKSDQIKIMQEYVNVNEYDSESLVDDILIKYNENIMSSNIGIHLQLHKQEYQFDVIRKIINKSHGPCKNDMLCNEADVFDADKCYYIEIIVDALKQFEKNDYHNINASELLGAYDHAVSVHNLCTLRRDTSEEIKLNEDTADDVQEVQLFIMNQLGGYCKSLKCAILQKHIMRRRELKLDEKQDDDIDEKDPLNEILHATLYALHCYILHQRRQLYRLQRENAASHFITTDDQMNISNQDNNNTEENKETSDVASVNFGVSVIEWLQFSEKAQFESLHDEIIQNQESTINETRYLNYSQECYIKIKNRKYAQYLLEEMMSLKIYTDTNSFQSSLRRAHWKSSSKRKKLSFYNWAVQLYKTAQFHACPIPRWSVKSTKPCSLYHGINCKLSLNDPRPKYNGPTSTSLERSVAHTFSAGKGLLWMINPSFANKFNLIIGIAVDWISQHKNEAEVLVVNQYLNIASTITFDKNIENNVDYLLYSIKSYKKLIAYPNKFYKILGVGFNESWVPFIRKHKNLYETTELENGKIVLERLMEELNIEQISDIYTVFL
eukprot:467959_1